MIHTVQLAVSDPVYAAALREALAHSGPWHIVSVERPDPSQQGVLVLDEDALERLPMPLADPERVVLVARKDARHLSLAWEAGIVSVVSVDDPPNTVLLAIMAAALRTPKARATAATGGLCPTSTESSASIPPENLPIPPKKHRTH